MLEIKNLKKSFGKLRVLKGINLEINKGDILAPPAVLRRMPPCGRTPGRTRAAGSTGAPDKRRSVPRRSGVFSP